MMREVIARALSEDGFAADWPHAERSADAALDAIREAGPTDAMVQAGVKAYGDDFYFKPEDAQRVFRAMIEAIGD